MRLVRHEKTMSEEMELVGGEEGNLNKNVESLNESNFSLSSV